MKEGDVVEIEYIGRIKESGELFDTTKKEVAEEENAVNERAKYEPIRIVVGAEMVVEGLDEAMKDMEVGDRREVEVPPEKAFGPREGDLIRTFSEGKFKDEDMAPYPGMRVSIDGKMGRVLSVNSGRVRVDLNHPLAGRTLDYEIEIKDVVEDAEEKVAAIAGHYLGEDPKVDIKEDTAIVEVPGELREEIREEIEEKVMQYTEVEGIDFEEVEDDGPE